MGRRRSTKTDFGTIILHWALVGLFVVSVPTGLRIATVSPLDFGWLQWLDALLPSTIVWTAHIPAALALFGLALAYPIYIRRAGLTRRIAPDAVRMRGIFRRGQPRWSAISIILTWMMLLTLLLLLATGWLMYLGYGGAVVTAHRFGTWIASGERGGTYRLAPGDRRRQSIAANVSARSTPHLGATARSVRFARHPKAIRGPSSFAGATAGGLAATTASAG